MRRNRSIWQDLDWLSVLLYLMLVIMGWATIYAADHDGIHTTIWDMTQSHGKQLMWAGVSLMIGFVILLVDSKFFTTFAYIIYALVIVLLIVTLAVAPEIKGARTWIKIGGFSLQSAEFAKFATSLALAKYLSTLNVNIKNTMTKMIAAVIIFFPALIIVIQGDAGSALVFTSFALVLYREGLPGWYLIAGLSAAVLAILALMYEELYLLILIVLVAAAVIYFVRKETKLIALTVVLALAASGYIYTVDMAFNKLSPHQKQRINVLIGKETNLQAAAYNLNQSMIAIGSGGLTGKGYLNGTQTTGNFVPEQTTDFIFCTIGEEQGFIGSAFVLLVFLALLLRIIFIAERQRSKFTRIYGYGVASILFFHILVNVGMTINLAPVMGIPLPFFSYGGSSILGFTTLLFILLKLDSDRLAVLR